MSHYVTVDVACELSGPCDENAECLQTGEGGRFVCVCISPGYIGSGLVGHCEGKC